jgi:hypothetical protein
MDLTTDDNLLATEDEYRSKELSSQFAAPAHTFMGLRLRSETAGSSHLFRQALDRDDKPLTVEKIYLFVHLETNWALNAKKEVVPSDELLEVCWDKNKMRLALFRWLETFQRFDSDEADKVFLAMREEADRGAVEVVPDGTEKKTKAKRRRT